MSQTETLQDPQTQAPQPPMNEPKQPAPGHESQMRIKPDYGEDSYQGTGKLRDRVAVITGADSGIGRAVALAFAREGADVVISFLDEEDDAQETARLVRSAGRKAVLMGGDIQSAEHCRAIIHRAVAEFGRVDVLVNNAAFQMSRDSLDEISDEEWDRTFRTNIHSMFYFVKAAVPHMRPGSAIINTASVNSDTPKPKLLPYSATKSAIVNFSGALAQLLAEKGIRVNSVAPGPIWTPLIPATMPPEQVENFGKQVPLQRAGQPRELAPLYVLLASDDGSYMSGGRYAVTGGTPIM